MNDKLHIDWTPEMSAALSRLIDSALKASGIAAMQDAMLFVGEVKAAAQAAQSATVETGAEVK